MDATAGHGHLEQGEAVVARVGAVSEIDALDRLVRVRRELVAEDVGQVEAEHVAEQGPGFVELLGRQHGMADAVLAGNEAFHADRRDEAGEVGGEAPGDFVAVAGGVGEADQVLHTARLAIRLAALADGDAGFVQRVDGGLESGLVAHFPAGGVIAVFLALDDGDAVLALVHLQVQTALGRLGGGHPQHFLAELLPFGNVGAFGHHIRERVDFHHFGGLRRCLKVWFRMAAIIKTSPL